MNRDEPRVTKRTALRDQSML